MCSLDRAFDTRTSFTQHLKTFSLFWCKEGVCTYAPPWRPTKPADLGGQLSPGYHLFPWGFGALPILPGCGEDITAAYLC